jgi:hypothetical protein
MYRVKLKYEDPFNDDRMVEEELLFNFTKAEVMLAMTDDDSFLHLLMSLDESTVTDLQVVKAITELALASYCERAGNRVVKNPARKAAFKTSPIFDALLEHLVSDRKNAVAFVTGIIPREAREQVANLLEAKK